MILLLDGQPYTKFSAHNLTTRHPRAGFPGTITWFQKEKIKEILILADLYVQTQKVGEPPPRVQIRIFGKVANLQGLTYGYVRTSTGIRNLMMVAAWFRWEVT